MHKIISLSHIPLQDIEEVVKQHFNKSSIFSYFFWKKKKKNTKLSKAVDWGYRIEQDLKWRYRSLYNTLYATGMYFVHSI